MTLVDTYDLALTTRSDEAVAAYRCGVGLLLSAWLRAAERLDAAITADPDSAFAHAARARLHANFGQSMATTLAIKRAGKLVAMNGTDRERSHVDVLGYAVAGRSREALSRALSHAERWPRDVLILSLSLGAFGLLAFSGMIDHDQARVDLVERHASHFDADDWWFQTYRGWALAENGDVVRARAMLERGRVSLGKRQRCSCPHSCHVRGRSW